MPGEGRLERRSFEHLPETVRIRDPTRGYCDRARAACHLSQRSPGPVPALPCPAPPYPGPAPARVSPLQHIWNDRGILTFETNNVGRECIRAGPLNQLIIHLTSPSETATDALAGRSIRP